MKPQTAILLLTIFVLTSCQYTWNEEGKFIFADKLKYSSRKLKFDKSRLLLPNDTVFSIDQNRFINVKNIIQNNTLIIEFAKGDCDVCIRNIFKILKSQEFADRNHKDIIVFINGFSPHDIIFTKKDMEIPYKILIADFGMKENLAQNSPKLFVVTKELLVKDLFIPVYDKPENTILYLKQILKVSI